MKARLICHAPHFYCLGWPEINPPMPAWLEFLADIVSIAANRTHTRVCLTLHTPDFGMDLQAFETETNRVTITMSRFRKSIRTHRLWLEEMRPDQLLHLMGSFEFRLTMGTIGFISAGQEAFFEEQEKTFRPNAPLEEDFPCELIWMGDDDMSLYWINPGADILNCPAVADLPQDHTPFFQF